MSRQTGVMDQARLDLEFVCSACEKVRVTLFNSSCLWSECKHGQGNRCDKWKTWSTV